jgi:ribosomal protein S18 acetylase RimI-like enzyme
VAFWVRPATIDDLTAVQRLFHGLDELHAGALPDVARLPEVSQVTAADLAEWIACENVLIAVAEIDGVVVGFVDASRHEPSDPTDVDRPWCGVNNLAVDPAHRRRGVATALVRTTEAWARSRGLDDVRLQVYEFNEAARALYERLGYVTLARRLRKPLERDPP